MPSRPTPEPYSPGPRGRTVSTMSSAVPPPLPGSPATPTLGADLAAGTVQRMTPEALLGHLMRGDRRERLTHVHRVPAREASPAPWPEWVTPTLYAALTQAGFTNLWSHQLEAAEAA